MCCFFFFSSRRRHTRFDCDWSSDVCSSDLTCQVEHPGGVLDKAVKVVAPKLVVEQVRRRFLFSLSFDRIKESVQDLGVDAAGGMPVDDGLHLLQRQAPTVSAKGLTQRMRNPKHAGRGSGPLRMDQPNAP